MKDIFDELRAELESVDRWLEALLNHPLPAKERELAEQLRKYVQHCYRDKKKWRSESAANIARIKLARWLGLALSAEFEEATTMKLSREVSHDLVKELIESLGEQRTQKILAVDEPRFKFLAKGHGCLSYEQLARIDRQSGRAWQRWIVDAGGRYATTAKARAFVASAHQMWDRILGPEKSSPPRDSTRRSKTLLRQAV